MDILNTLNEKDGYAFMILEEAFWTLVINKALEKHKGNVTNACENLGISPVTMRTRCKRHGIDIAKYKVKNYRERADRKEKREYWKFLIEKAFNCDNPSIHKAAKNLDWSPSTVYRRMQAVGLSLTDLKLQGKK